MDIDNNCKSGNFRSHYDYLPRLDKSSWFDDHLLPHPLLPIACLLPITINNDRNFSLDGIYMCNIKSGKSC